MIMTVKEYLLNNVRGRVRDQLWEECKKGFDEAEKEATTKKTDYTDVDKLKTFYEVTKEVYKKYESLVKELESEKETTD